jgi:hypothetical protein
MMLPTGSGYGNATTLTNLYTVQRWLKKYARENRNIFLFDGHGYFCDPTDGMPVSGYVRPNDTAPENNNRGVHPGFLGAAAIGRALAEAAEPLFQHSIAATVSSNVDTLNLCTNGRLVGDQGNGLATGYTLIDNSGSAAQGAVATKVNRWDGRPGQVQQIVWNGTGTACRLFFQNTDTSKWTTGDQVYAEVEFETDPDTAGSYVLKLNLNSWNAGSTGGVGSIANRSQDNPLPTGVDVWPRRGVIRTPPYTVPASTLRLQTDLYVPVGTTRVRHFAIRKVDY